MTTERDLIQRLADMADALDGRKPLVFAQGQVMDGFTALANFQALANEARAYLDQPEPEVPTDEELLAILSQAVASFPPIHPEAEAMSAVEYDWELETRKARAVLARWGRATVEPPAKPAHNTAQDSSQRP